MDSVETKASAKYIRISPRKARLVVDLIRGRDVADAQQILDYSPKAAARVVGKILNSAIANAEHNNKLDPDELYVCRAYVDEGPTLKRFRPRAMGRATRINKRTSHITLVLDEREPRAEAKRRRFRRPVRKKAAAEPEMAPEAQRAEDEESPEAQRADADEAELNADTEAEEDLEEELDVDEETAPEPPQAEADQPELNADTKADDSESED
jgi:large subunit ribosomal protein L22